MTLTRINPPKPMKHTIKLFLRTLAAVTAAAGIANAVKASVTDIDQPDEDVVKIVHPVCGEPGATLVVTLPASKRRTAETVLERIEAIKAFSRTSDTAGCVQRGGMAGAWVYEGSPNAMLTGVVPAGPDRHPHLLVWSPHYQLVKTLGVTLAGETH